MMGLACSALEKLRLQGINNDNVKEIENGYSKIVTTSESFQFYSSSFFLIQSGSNATFLLFIEIRSYRDLKDIYKTVLYSIANLRRE
jgi:hypothetical protein